MSEMITYTLPKEQTVEALFQEWQVGKKFTHSLRMSQAVLLNNEPVNWLEHYPQGTVLTIQLAKEDQQTNYYPTEHGITILYEDQHLLAVHKPAGISVHPNHAAERNTMSNWLQFYANEQGFGYVEHVHRLDEGTAGILLFAKNGLAKRMLDRLFEQQAVTRKYRALVDGKVKRPRGTLQFPIGRDRHHPTRRRVSPTGQPALTRFKVMERREDSTVVEAELESGRTHQIRVHFSHLGNPVVGDTIYGGSKTDNGKFSLTATELLFTHPLTHEALHLHTNN